MEKKIERRRLIKPLEVRTADDGGLPTIEGYAAVYNQIAEICGFYEMLDPGVVALSLADPDSLVIACFNHDCDQVPLARYKAGSGTLALREDNQGLFVSFQPANTTLGRDVVESISRGDTDGMSIGFYVMMDDWNGTYNGLPLRRIQQIQLVDICVTPTPAYSQTSVALRSEEKKDEFSINDYAALLAEKAKPGVDLVKMQSESRARKLRLIELTNTKCGA